MLSNYDKLKSIGSGTYGVVYKARDTRSNEWVALKRIYTEEADEGVSATTLREVALLKQLKHRNIVALKTTFFHRNEIYLVLQRRSEAVHEQIHEGLV